MEAVCTVVGSLPPELYAYVLNKTIQTLFTKTEIIRFLMLNEEFCKDIWIHDLTVTITDRGYLKFDEDPLSNDLINLRDFIFGNVKIFAKLFETHTISIQNLILHANVHQLAFLANYAVYIQCESFNALCMSMNLEIDMKKVRMITLSFYKNHFAQFYTMAKNISILPCSAHYVFNFAISDHHDFKEVINILHYCSTKLHLRYTIRSRVLFFLNMTISNDSKLPTNKLIKYFSYCLFLLEEYKVSTTDIKVVLKISLADPSLRKSDEFLKLCKYIGFQFIHKLIIESDDDGYYQFDFRDIRQLTSLRLLEVRCDQQCGFENFGDLSNLKYLRKLVFQCNNVELGWLSHNLPHSVETVQLFRTLKNNEEKDKSIFEIPDFLQNLIIETDLPEVVIDFERFKFNPTIRLQRIIILDHFVKKPAVKILNLQQIPRCLKEFRFHDSNNFTSSLHENYFKFPGGFDSSQLEGVYSNIDVEFTSLQSNKIYMCLCSYSLRILNLKSKRIRNFRGCTKKSIQPSPVP